MRTSAAIRCRPREDSWSHGGSTGISLSEDGACRTGAFQIGFERGAARERVAESIKDGLWTGLHYTEYTLSDVIFK